MVAIVLGLGLVGIGVGCGENSGQVTVPDVSGEEISVAFTRICEVGLTPIVGDPMPSPPLEALPKVVETSPPADAEVDVGSEVIATPDRLVVTGLPDPGPLECESLLRSAGS